MTDEEKRAYNKGYKAGLSRKEQERCAKARHRAENRFWRETFLTALNATVVKGGWKIGENTCNTTEEYIKLAGLIADEAVSKHGWRA